MCLQCNILLETTANDLLIFRAIFTALQLMNSKHRPARKMTCVGISDRRRATRMKLRWLRSVARDVLWKARRCAAELESDAEKVSIDGTPEPRNSRKGKEKASLNEARPLSGNLDRPSGLPHHPQFVVRVEQMVFCFSRGINTSLPIQLSNS